MRMLVATPYEMMVELDDIGVDYEEITEFELFILMFESIAVNESNTSIIFGDLNLKDFREAYRNDINEKILINITTGVIIDRLVAMEIRQAIRKIHQWKNEDKKAGNKAAKEYLLERARIKKKRLERKPYHSFLQDMVVFLVNTEEFKYNYESSLTLPISLFIASKEQIPAKKEWEQVMNGVYFGTVDSSKINLEKIHWMYSERLI